ncbi:hypothetical protein ASF49_13650 [Methylobacterium sp. Leaf104]|uniref:hypothetical protein n=1 Tax=Methylobacterium TaxID=407 RepID=UPI0006F65E5C|nr:MULTISPECIES: hypothetical protein [Methylobacterium]KQP30547.1 hypothetical protein ASF49_13650 [Methylobacterium sp. Leaf104]MCI9882070.1 hypothetical protein [Methylobacterium goesingense]
MRDDTSGRQASPHAYRVLLLDASGRVLRTKSLAGCTEAEAIERARDFVDGRSVELWDGSRLIQRLDASHDPEADEP